MRGHELQITPMCPTYPLRRTAHLSRFPRALYRLRGTTAGACAAVCLAATTLATSLLGCHDEPPQRQPVAATPAPVTPPSPLPAAPPGAGWDSAAGSALVIAAGMGSDTVAVLRPDFVQGRYTDTSTFDLRALSHTHLDLFARSGAVGSATLMSGVYRRSGTGCTSWPLARITDSTSHWQVALESGRALGIPVDSIAGMPPQDSARVVSAVKHAAAMSLGRSDSVFGGLPFLVRRAYRFRLGSTTAIAALLQRSIPSEADPREEQLFLIAEPVSPGDSTYQAAFLRRSSGDAHPAQVTSLLAAITLRANHRPMLVVSNEYEDGGTVSMIERLAPGRWRESWKSGYTGC